MQIMMFLTGLFCICKLDKNISTPIFVKPNDSEEQFTSINLVKLDSLIFNVYSEDRITVARLFTADFVERLDYLKNKFSNSFDFSIIDNLLYIRIPGIEFFEPEETFSLNHDKLLYYYNHLQLAKTLSIYINNQIKEKEF